METLTLLVGNSKITETGFEEGEIRPVTFVGEELATSTFHTGPDGTGTVTETLYRTETGRLVVQIEDLSKPGEKHYSLHPVTPEDMERGGKFAALGEGGWFWALFQPNQPPG
jgi:hypothetical protein